MHPLVSHCLVLPLVVYLVSLSIKKQKQKLKWCHLTTLVYKCVCCMCVPSVTGQDTNHKKGVNLEVSTMRQWNVCELEQKSEQFGGKKIGASKVTDWMEERINNKSWLAYRVSIPSRFALVRVRDLSMKQLDRLEQTQQLHVSQHLLAFQKQHMIFILRKTNTEWCRGLWSNFYSPTQSVLNFCAAAERFHSCCRCRKRQQVSL